MLYRAVPGCDVHDHHAQAHSLLPVQRRLPVSVVVRLESARLLAARGLRREGDARHHSPPRLLCLHAADSREYASHVGVRSTHRYGDVTKGRRETCFDLTSWCK